MYFNKHEWIDLISFPASSINVSQSSLLGTYHQIASHYSTIVIHFKISTHNIWESFKCPFWNISLIQMQIVSPTLIINTKITSLTVTTFVHSKLYTSSTNISQSFKRPFENIIGQSADSFVPQQPINELVQFSLFHESFHYCKIA